MELVVLEIVLRVIRAVHHATGAAGGRSELPLPCILKEPVRTRHAGPRRHVP